MWEKKKGEISHEMWLGQKKEHRLPKRFQYPMVKRKLRKGGKQSPIQKKKPNQKREGTTRFGKEDPTKR